MICFALAKAKFTFTNEKRIKILHSLTPHSLPHSRSIVDVEIDRKDEVYVCISCVLSANLNPEVFVFQSEQWLVDSDQCEDWAPGLHPQQLRVQGRWLPTSTRVSRPHSFLHSLQCGNVLRPLALRSVLKRLWLKIFPWKGLKNV